MEKSEAQKFPKFHRNQLPYLAIRNLAIAVWFSDPCVILRKSELMKHVFVPGLARIAYACFCEDVINYLTQYGVINYGIMDSSGDESKCFEFATSKKTENDFESSKFSIPPIITNLHPQSSSKKILIIGAGPAGISTACQLQRFGFRNVKILEARGRTGGRIKDVHIDAEKQYKVGSGAMIVNGCVNNPICLMYRQLGIGLYKLRQKCGLFDSETGLEIENEPDEQVQSIFNTTLEEISKHRKVKRMFEKEINSEKIDQSHVKSHVPTDTSLQTMLNMFGQKQLSNSSIQEARIFDFHRANLEYSCGASLKKVSAMHWDQNEEFPQFAGDHIWMHRGMNVCFDELKVGLDIEFGRIVQKIVWSRQKEGIGAENDDFELENNGFGVMNDDSESKIEHSNYVELASGKQIHFDYLVTTIPLSLLKNRSIRYEPTLPKSKENSISKLGVGLIEKVILHFPTKFWQGTKSIDSADFFGVINSSSTRGEHSVFYDVTPTDMETGGILLTISSGDFVSGGKYSKASDSHIVNSVMKMLKKIFGKNKVSEPAFSLVTRWGDDMFSKMSYSYVGVGGSGADYDEMAKSVGDRLFFAGEATNRHFPQTVTGAYLSGVREAGKITQIELDKMTHKMNKANKKS